MILFLGMFAALDGVLGSVDAWLGAVWAGLLSSRIVYWDMLEAYVSGIAFAVWIMGYRLLDQVPYFHKYRFEKDRCAPSSRGSRTFRRKSSPIFTVCLRRFRMFLSVAHV